MRRLAGGLFQRAHRSGVLGKTLGTNVGRMALGAGIGGIYGAATTDSNIAGMGWRNALLGAAAGAGIAGGFGIATSKTLWRNVFRGPLTRYRQSLISSYSKQIGAGAVSEGVAQLRAMGAALGPMGESALGGLKMAGQAGGGVLNFATKHPKLIGGGLILGLAYTGVQGMASGEQPSSSRMAIAQKYLDLGIGSEEQRIKLQNSTYNLVGGLHQRRHG